MSGYNPYTSGAAGYSNGAGLQQQLNPSRNGNGMLMLGTQDGLEPASGQSLDDIVNQNSKTVRRQSMPQRFSSQQNNMDADMRRISMMEFTGASPTGPLDHFQFDPVTSMSQADAMTSDTPMHISNPNMQSQRRTSAGELALNTPFAASNSAYGPVMPHGSAFQSPADTALDLDMTSPYMSNPMAMNIDFSNSPNYPGVMAVDQSSMAMYSGTPYHTSLVNSPVQSAVNTSRRSTDQGGNGLDRQRPRFEPSQSRSSSDVNRSTMTPQPSRSHSMQASNQTTHPQLSRQQSGSGTPQRQEPQQHAGFAAQPQHPQPGSAQDRGVGPGSHAGLDPDPSNYNSNNQGLNWEAPDGGWPSTMTGRPHMQSEYKNAYSSTGFDMLGVLVRCDSTLLITAPCC